MHLVVHEFCGAVEIPFVFPYIRQIINDKISDKINNSKMPHFSTKNYKVNEKCQMPIYMRLAEQLCPHTCAMCCKTRKFNCRDVAQCENFSQEMCRMPSLGKIALEFCPHTCGLCDLPGAGGECPDSIDGCESLRGFCQLDSIRNICQRTCISRASSQSSGCADAHVDCPLYRHLCSIGDYGIVMRTQCRRTCRHC
ncbi:unnamed protein product [Dracunculus medinensis]|uniref:ShKT domain-containing protein n=1 Tax=Dracunculus medinensis TaxID=318479 RepID=A0A3P7QWG6_DRAME|nr:unnamed protein product [Dracunculus medinensis]